MSGLGVRSTDITHGHSRTGTRRDRTRPGERWLSLCGLHWSVIAGTGAGCHHQPVWRDGAPAGRLRPSARCGDNQGTGWAPQGLGLGCRAAGRASARRGGPWGQALLPLSLLNGDISSRNSRTQPSPGHVRVVSGTRPSCGGSGVHLCCWLSTERPRGVRLGAAAVAGGW